MALRNPRFILLEHIKEWVGLNFKKTITIPRQGQTTNYYKICTINGLSSSSGAGVTLRFSGVNNYGDTARSSMWLNCVQRGNNIFSMEMYTLGKKINSGILEIGYVKKGALEYEVWVKVHSYFDEFRIELDNPNVSTYVTFHRPKETVVTTEPTGYNVEINTGNEEDINQVIHTGNILKEVDGDSDLFPVTQKALKGLGWGSETDDGTPIAYPNTVTPGNYKMALTAGWSLPGINTTTGDGAVFIYGSPLEVGTSGSTKGEIVQQVSWGSRKFIRSADVTNASGQPVWGDWEEPAYKSDIVGEILSIPRPLGTINLNMFTEPGVYYQSANINATTARNYPTNRAGTLEVLKASGLGSTSAGIIQRYNEYLTGTIYTRGTSDGLSWNPWRRMADQNDINSVISAVNSSSGVGEIKFGPYVEIPPKHAVLEGGSFDAQTTSPEFMAYVTENYATYPSNTELFSYFKGCFRNWGGVWYYPDMRGLFVRGHGSHDSRRGSTHIGFVQPDALETHRHAYKDTGKGGYKTHNGLQDVSGAGAKSYLTHVNCADRGNSTHVGWNASSLSLKGSDPYVMANEDTETRPINVAWKYIVKIKP